MRSRQFYFYIFILLIAVTSCTSTPPIQTDQAGIGTDPIIEEGPALDFQKQLSKAHVSLEIDSFRPSLVRDAIAKTYQLLGRQSSGILTLLKTYDVRAIRVSASTFRNGSTLYVSPTDLEAREDMLSFLEPLYKSEALQLVTGIMARDGIALEPTSFWADRTPFVLGFLERDHLFVSKELKKRGISKLKFGPISYVRSQSKEMQMNAFLTYKSEDEARLQFQRVLENYGAFRKVTNSIIRRMAEEIKHVDIQMDVVDSASLEQFTKKFSVGIEFYKDIVKEYGIETIIFSNETYLQAHTLYVDVSANADLVTPERLKSLFDSAIHSAGPLFTVGTTEFFAHRDDTYFPIAKVKDAKKFFSQTEISRYLSTAKVEKVYLTTFAPLFQLNTTVEKKVEINCHVPFGEARNDWFIHHLLTGLHARDRNLAMERRFLSSNAKKQIQFSYLNHAQINPKQLQTFFDALSRNDQFFRDRSSLSIELSDKMQRQAGHYDVDVTTKWFNDSKAMIAELNVLFGHVRTPSQLKKSDFLRAVDEVGKMADVSETDGFERGWND